LYHCCPAVAAAKHHPLLIPIIRCLDLHLLAHELRSVLRLHSYEEPGGREKTPTCVRKFSLNLWKLCSRCQKQPSLMACPASGSMSLKGRQSFSKLLYKGEYLCATFRFKQLKCIVFRYLPCTGKIATSHNILTLYFSFCCELIIGVIYCFPFLLCPLP